MNDQITKEYEPEWENWHTSGVNKFGADRTQELAIMVADACDLLKANSRDETDFLVLGVTMLMKNISEAAEEAISTLERS